MAELSLKDKCKLAATLVEQSPPGEVNDVINGLRTIIADDEALMPHVRPALRTYNLAQLTVVEHPEAQGIPAHSTLLSEATILPGTTEGEDERYIDAEGKRSYAFDHITLAITDYRPYELPEEEETFRAELAKSLAAYTKNHFPSGYSSVASSQYPLLPPAPTPPPVEAAPVSTTIAVPETETSTQAETTATTEKAEEPITDVISEQLAAGDNEPAPTPTVGDSPKEEVDQPGGLEKVDEKVEEVKEDEAQEEESGVDVEKGGDSQALEEKAVGEKKIEGPTVVEEGGEAMATPDETEESAAPAVVAQLQAEAEPVPAPVERKQEKVENPLYTLEIVGNRYNTSNFWTGRWRTRWVVDQAAGVVSGTIKVDVHYFEQGNVQLTTNHSASFPCPPQPTGSQSIASQIVTTISKLETKYHLELNDVYGELGDKAFRALRRALPVTRQKMDWDKVGGYSLGADLTKARA